MSLKTTISFRAGVAGLLLSLVATFATVNSASALTPVIDPVIDTERLITDPQALAHYEQLLLKAPDFSEQVPDAEDYSTIVYIDPSAPVSGSGTSPEDPLNSWAGLSLAEGSAYLQKCGTEAIFPTIIVAPGNTLFGAYGEGPRPIVTVSENMTGDRGAFHLNHSDIVVRDLHVRAPKIAACIRIGVDAKRVTVFNCEVEDSNWGIRCFGAQIRILKSIVHTIQDDGIFTQIASDVEIGYNYIFRVNTNWVDPYTPQNVAGGDAVQLHNVSNWHVHHNVLDRSDTGNKFAFISNVDRGHIGTGILDGNFMIGPKKDGDGGATVYMGSYQDGYIIRNNIFTRAQTGVFYVTSRDLQVYGNVFANNQGGVFGIAYYLHIYNNVFWNNTGDLVRGTSAKVLNNVFDIRSSANVVTGFAVLKDNLFTAAPPGLGGGIISINLVDSNPGFVDAENGNFRPQPGSPLVEAGQLIKEIALPEDPDGTPVPQGDAPEIGAFELAETVEGAPEFPQGLVALARGSEVHLSWEASSLATGYLIYQKIGDGPFTEAGTTFDTSFTVTDLEYNLTCRYQVVATNAAGSSLKSMIVTVITLPKATEWAGYPFTDGNWVDTGNWMGWLYVQPEPWLYTPWIYSDSRQGWIYIHPVETSNKAWFYVPNYQ